MREPGEIGVEGEELPRRFEGARGDPDVIDGNRRARASKLGKDLSITPSYLSRDGSDDDEGFGEKLGEHHSVLLGVTSESKASLQLSDDDRGQVDDFSCCAPV